MSQKKTNKFEGFFYKPKPGEKIRVLPSLNAGNNIFDLHVGSITFFHDNYYDRRTAQNIYQYAMNDVMQTYMFMLGEKHKLIIQMQIENLEKRMTQGDQDLYERLISDYVS